MRCESGKASPGEAGGPEEGSAFKAQLYGSSTARVQKAREAERRFARLREEGGGRGRNWAITFGILFLFPLASLMGRI